MSESAFAPALGRGISPENSFAEEPIGPLEPLPVDGASRSACGPTTYCFFASVRWRESCQSALRVAFGEKSPSLGCTVAHGGTSRSKEISRGGRSDWPKPQSDCEGSERQQWPNGPDKYFLHRMLQATAALRDHFKA